MNDKVKKLKRLQVEDWIWIIYIFVAIFAIVSNHFERKYELTNNLQDRNKYKTINIILFTVAFFIYLYFEVLNYEDINEFKVNATKKEVLTKHASFIASTLFLIGGIIYLIVEITTATDVEAAII